MRAFQLTAILVASLSVSAQSAFSSASVSISGDCSSDCAASITSVQDLKTCLASVVKNGVDDCNSATLTLNYEVTGTVECEKATRRLLAASVPSPDTGKPTVPLPYTDILKDISTNIGTVTDLELKSATLGYKVKTAADCATSTAYIVTGSDVCTGDGTDGSLTVSKTDSDVTLEPKSANTKVLVKDTDGLLVAWTSAATKTCTVVAATSAKQTLKLSGTIAVTPSSKSLTGQVVFNDGCTVAGCDSVKTTSQAQLCLDKAAEDTKCETATYSRTFTHVLGTACSPAVPVRVEINLAEVLVDETTLLSSAEKTVVTEVYFPRKAAAACNKASVYLVDSCTATLGTPLGMTQSKDILEFTGSQELDANAQKGMILVGFEELTNKCTLTKDNNGDKISLDSTYTISHSAPSGSLAQLSLSTLFVASILAVSAL